MKKAITTTTAGAFCRNDTKVLIDGSNDAIETDKNKYDTLLANIDFLFFNQASTKIGDLCKIPNRIFLTRHSC
jgi:ribosomal protein L30E